MTAPNHATQRDDDFEPTRSASRHRPDGTTPEPEHDDLTARTRHVADRYVNLNTLRRQADLGECRMLAESYDIAEEHTRRDAEAGAHLISDENRLQSHLAPPSPASAFAPTKAISPSRTAPSTRTGSPRSFRSG